jgi:YD repeat-containing protein
LTGVADEAGRVIDSSHPNSSQRHQHQRIPQHDAHGRPEVIVAPDGSRTRLSYNQRGALTRLVQGEQITHFTYDARGVMTRIKTPDGSVFALVYDSDVNLTQVKHNGKAITAGYVATLLANEQMTIDSVRFAFPQLFPDPFFSRQLSRQQANAIRREQPQAVVFMTPQFWGLARTVAVAFATAWGTWNTKEVLDRSSTKKATGPRWCPVPGYGDTQPQPPAGPLINLPLTEEQKQRLFPNITTSPGENIASPADTGGNQLKPPSIWDNLLIYPTPIPRAVFDVVLMSTNQSGNGSGSGVPADSVNAGVDLRADLSRQSGIPTSTTDVWGSSLSDLKQAFSTGGATVTEGEPRASSSGNAQILHVQGSSTGIVQIQYSPASESSTHKGQYYKFTYKDGWQLKVIDPSTYRPRLSGWPENDGKMTFVDTNGKTVVFNPETKTWK